MLHGEPPFAESDQMATFKRIAAGKYRVSSRVGKDAADIIAAFLQQNPAKRLGMLVSGEKGVYRHRFCANVDISKMLKKQITPPFIPKLKHPADTSNFDSSSLAPVVKTKFDKYLDAKYDELWEREFG